MKHEYDCDTNCNRYTRNDPQRLGKGAGSIGSRRNSINHPNYNIVKIGRNSEKRPGDLRRLAVTPVKDYQLTLV